LSHSLEPEGIASAILRDLSIALGLARPDATSAPFDWLGQAFGDDVYSPTVDRLVNAWRAADAPLQAKTRSALILAIDRASTAWLGAERTLALLDWAHDIAPEDIPASRWIALLFHRNPADPAETAYWVRQIVERLDRWQLNRHALLASAEAIPPHEWVRLVLSTSERDRVDVAGWLLRLLRARPALCRAVWDAVVKNWKAKLPDLPDGYGDWHADIIDPLTEAAHRPDFALADYGGSGASRRRALRNYVADFKDWPSAA
jgi:hypothetical protein